MRQRTPAADKINTAFPSQRGHRRIIRQASDEDLESIASVCADGWLETYRGLVPDDFLDRSLTDYLYTKYQEKLHSTTPGQYSFVLEEGEKILGFAQIDLDENEKTGSLLDSLYVTREARGSGVGTQLLSKTAQLVITEASSARLYLLVLQASDKAQRFMKNTAPQKSRKTINFMPDVDTLMAFIIILGLMHLFLQIVSYTMPQNHL